MRFVNWFWKSSGAVVVMLSVGCTTTNTGQIHERTLTRDVELESVRYELAWSDRTVEINLIETVSVEVEIMAVKKRTRRTATARLIEDAGKQGPLSAAYLLVFGAPVTLVVDAATLGTTKDTVTQHEKLDSERRRQEQPPPREAMVVGNFTLADGVTGRLIDGGAVSEGVRDGAVSVRLPPDVGGCLLFHLDGELRSHGGLAPLKVAERLGC